VACATSSAIGTAASRVPTTWCGTLWDAKVAENIAASRPISRARATRGKYGASGSIPPDFPLPPAIQTRRS